MNNPTERFISKVAPGSAWFKRLPSATEPAPGSRAVLALDPGLRVGWAVITLPQKQVIAGGFTELDRRHLFFCARKLVVDLLPIFKPEVVLLEQSFLGAGAVLSESMEMRGALKATIEEAELPWAQIHPSTVRSILGLRSKRSDALVREAVLGLMPGLPTHYRPVDTGRLRFYPADVWDALALAWAADTVEEILP